MCDAETAREAVVLCAVSLPCCPKTKCTQRRTRARSFIEYVHISVQLYMGRPYLNVAPGVAQPETPVTDNAHLRH